MSVDIDERHGRSYNDDLWPDGYDAIAIAIPGDWQQAEVTFTCDSRVLLYEDRLPVTGRTITASRSLTGVVYVLSPPEVHIFTHWEKKGATADDVYVVRPAPADTTIEFRDGLPMVLNAEGDDPEFGDEITVQEITSTYRSHEAWIKAVQMIGPDDVVLDLGAHIGTFTRDALARNPQKVIAIEANQRNFGLLKQNAKLAESSASIEVLLAAATADTSESHVRLWVYPQNARINKPSKMRFVMSSLTHTRFKVPVAIRALGWRELLDEYKPTVVKIDTEGAECSWDFSNLPAQLKAIAIEAEVGTLVTVNGVKVNWYDEVFVPQMTGTGFVRVEPKRLWGHTRDELWVRTELESEWS